jgi:carboxyl-terminal processing protease
MPLRDAERRQILIKIKELVLEKHINVADPHQDYGGWAAEVDRRTDELHNVGTDQEFEASVREMLATLGSSHTAFFHESSSDIPAPHAVHATLRQVETAKGKRWMFVDVFEEGIAWTAGVRPGYVLWAVDGVLVAPPDQVHFKPGTSYQLSFGVPEATEPQSARIDVPNKLAKDRPPMIEPRSLVHRMISDDTGLLKVVTFPGAIGNEFAGMLDHAIEELKSQGSTKLVIDLRGNVGGGLGSLRLMSYLCPGKIPVGHSLTRKRLQAGYTREGLVRIGKIPRGKLDLLLMFVRFRFIQRDRSMVLVTEGLGPQPFHGRIAILTNEFTHSAAEMVASFAKENGLATLVGTRTAGEVLGGANFRVGGGYRLRMPVAGWYTWQEQPIEGCGVAPDVSPVWASDESEPSHDVIMKAAVDILHS